MEQQKTEQYKKEIAEMVEEIEIPGFISMIYGFVRGLYEEEKKRKGVVSRWSITGKKCWIWPRN